MSEGKIPFNINHYVYVKLTDYGIECLQKEHDELFGAFKFELRIPPEDENGWTKWQLHDIMSKLGKYFGGLKVPFETNILIENDI